MSYPTFFMLWVTFIFLAFGLVLWRENRAIGAFFGALLALFWFLHLK